MRFQIIPTLIAINQKELDSLLKRYEGISRYFQVDIMDGKFVKNKSNWFNLKLNKRYSYEAHLMVNNPEEWTYKNYKKVNIIIANSERVKNPIKLIKFLKNKKKKIAFALNPETSINSIKPYLRYLDRVLIFTVHPGKYGSAFVHSTLKKITMLRKIFKKDIEVDGHINPKNIKKCKKAGANLFAVGSFLKKNKDLKKAMIDLKQNLYNY